MDDVQKWGNNSYPIVEGQFITVHDLQRLIAIERIAGELLRLVEIDMLCMGVGTAYATDVLRRAKAAGL